ncbi:MAG: contractile injection system protein, VgrG/Pvc8 family, partial [Acidobacteriota bacterium]|nr:contractile injection system protein, VgrG/Pvc8 family [Acidobacteriota bacterium]
MPTYTQDKRRIRISTPLGKDVLLLKAVRGREGVSRLFEFELDLLSTNRSISFDKIVGKPATVSFVLGDDSVRPINGVISSFSQGGVTGNLARYSATLVPWAWFLTQTSDSRIFQNLSVPDIIQKVFKDFG